MHWAFHIGRIGGTNLRIHFSFLLFLAWIGFSFGRAGGPYAAMGGLSFVCLIFVCVLLHEGGHALAAAHYGIRTPDITLLPIGGIARLERMPEKPGEEIVVALAGPAVNVVLAALLWAGIAVASAWTGLGLDSKGLELPLKLLGVNLWLVVFNLIPAFPMDGGRVLRALLAKFTEHAKATLWAANIGQGIAISFALLGVVTNPMLILIALVIYFGAASELTMARIKSFSEGLRVSAAMQTQFESLDVNSSLHDGLQAVCHTVQHELPVVDGTGQFCGMLTRDDMIAALRHTGAQTPVSEVMRVGILPLDPTAPLQRAVLLLQECDCPALPVVDMEGRLVGLFTPESLNDLMLVQNALANAPGPLGKESLPTT